MARTTFPPPTINLSFVTGSAQVFTPLKSVAYFSVTDARGFVEAYQSISTHPEFQMFSPEELRLRDYKAGTYGRLYSPSVGYVKAIFGSLANIRPVSSERVFPKRPKVLGHQMVTFQVGGEPGEKFSVHESVIVHRSEFVRLSLQGDWKEAKERVIPLSDDDPAMFALYQHFLYSGAIYTKGLDTGTHTSNEYELLVKMYVFGEKILDSGFKDATIDAIIDKMRTNECFDTRLTDLVYDGTPEGSPLRRLWLEVYYWAGKAEWLDQNCVGAPVNSEFLCDFSKFQMSQRVGFGRAMFADGDCTYHSHVSALCYRFPF